MAQSGYTPIQLYRTTTSSAAPTAGNLADGELAINTTDEKLYFKNAAGTVKLLAANVTPTANGGTGQSSYTIGDLLYASGSTTLSKLADVATGNALISGGVGVAPSYGKIGLTTHVSGTLPVGNGGTGTATAFTSGSVVFAGASGVYAQDNANLFWDDTNNTLGIGTSSPGTTRLYISTNRATNPNLQVWDTFNGATFENSALLSYDGTKTFFYNFQANPLAFGTNNTERMRIDASGNVGIGTSSPGAKLTTSQSSTTAYASIFNTPTVGLTAGDYVNMAYFANGRGTNNDGLRIVNLRDSTGSGTGNWETESYRIRRSVDQNDGSTGVQEEIVFGNNLLAFNTGGSERMRIDSSGNVGIGTSSPSERLIIQGSTTNVIAQIRNSSTVNSSSKTTAIQFIGTDTVGAAKETGDIYVAPADNNYVGSNMLFYTRGSDAVAERLRVGELGQIGIGGANYGTAGQVLTSNGSGSAPSWQTGGGTGTLKNVQVFTSSGTYTRTAGVTTAVVIAVGGGGGGKGVNGPAAQAGGNGGAGGTTSFGAHVSAAGGSGATNDVGAAGGTGGTGANIAIKGAPSPGNAGGGQGGGTPVNNAAGVAGVRGGGGSGGSFLDGCFNFYEGAGGGQGETAIKYTTTVGATETVTIGAGGTAGTSNASRAAGAGGAGYIIVYEYS